MKKYIYISVLSLAGFLIAAAESKAQNPDIKRTYHWYFGSGAGLDFSSGNPVAITNSPMTAEEGCASISDTCGDLLFYTDGDTVWNSNHQIMQNGTGLMGCWSSTQNSLIVPQPDNDSIYYIFLTDCGEHFGGANGLRYSVVNINRNEGLGEVMQKNALLYAPAMEKLAATYHANGNSIWILSVNRYPPGPPPDTTQQYYAYLFNPSGIDIIPVISPSKVSPKWDDGYLRFSHNGKKVANVWHAPNGTYCDTLEVLDFNSSTGILSNSFTLVPDSSYQPYGLVFSPDDTKLYHSLYNDVNPDWPNLNFKIYQYDLSGNDSASVAASKTLIQYNNSSSSPMMQEFCALQVGSDGRIYIAKQNNVGPPWYPDSIDVITNPNAAGLACNYVVNGSYIGGNSRAGLPNFVDSYFRGSWQEPCSVGVEENISFDGNIYIYPNPFSDYTTLRTTNFNELQIRDFKLFNSMGQEMKIKIIRNSDSYVISRSNLVAGIYFLDISNGCIQHSIHKIIIY